MLTQGYTTFPSSGASSGWLQVYKFVCLFFAIVGAVLSVYFLVHLFIGLAYLNPSIYNAISCAIFIFETIIFYLEFKALHNNDGRLANDVVRLSVINLIVLPAWELLGGLLLLNYVPTAIGSAIAAFIVAGIFLWINVMAKRTLEGKTGLGIHRSDLNV